jgi:hypothetical protein
MNIMSTMVANGRACVDWYAQATVLTKLHTTKKGTEKRLPVRMTFQTQLWPPSFLNMCSETKPDTEEVRA